MIDRTPSTVSRGLGLAATLSLLALLPANCGTKSGGAPSSSTLTCDVPIAKLADPSGALQARLATDHILSIDEKKLVAAYWIYLVVALDRGEVSTAFLESDLPRRMGLIGQEYPSLGTLCSGMPVTTKAEDGITLDSICSTADYQSQPCSASCFPGGCLWKVPAISTLGEIVPKFLEGVPRRQWYSLFDHITNNVRMQAKAAGAVAGAVTEKLVTTVSADAVTETDADAVLSAVGTALAVGQGVAVLAAAPGIAAACAAAGAAITAWQVGHAIGAAIGLAAVCREYKLANCPAWSEYTGYDPSSGQSCVFVSQSTVDTCTVTGSTSGTSSSGTGSGSSSSGASGSSSGASTSGSSAGGSSSGGDASIDSSVVPPLGPAACTSPYDGNWAGDFTYAFGATHVDSTGKTVDDPPTTASFHVTISMRCLAATTLGTVLTITHASITEPYFGCADCVPQGSSSAILPGMPGGATQAGMGIGLDFPNGTNFITSSNPGDLSVSPDGRILSDSGDSTCAAGSSTWTAGVVLPIGAMNLWCTNETHWAMTHN